MKSKNSHTVGAIPKSNIIYKITVHIKGSETSQYV